MFCMKCGKQVENGRNFCSYCGAPQPAPRQGSMPNGAAYMPGAGPVNPASKKPKKKMLLVIGAVVLAAALVITAVLLLQRPSQDPVFGGTEDIILEA